MNLEAIISHYGLAAVFLGAAVEGEVAVVAGGLLAHRGFFPLPGAMAAAAAGSFVADQLWFLAGRRFQHHRWVRAAHERPAFSKAIAAFRRYPVAFIFAFRFVYGLRTVSPVAIGTTDVSARLFVAVNLASAITWGVLFSTIGYHAGRAFAALLGRLEPDTPTLLAILAAVLAVATGIALWRRRKR